MSSRATTVERGEVVASTVLARVPIASEIQARSTATRAAPWGPSFVFEHAFSSEVGAHFETLVAASPRGSVPLED